jgi:ArsR family transcriptional regulator
MDTFTNLSSEINQLHADICSALADPTRILMLYLLSEHPYTVNELTEKLGVTQPSTSRHLKILRDRGLVQASRRGQAVEYSLRDRRLIDSLDTLRDVLKDSLAYRASLIAESV